MLYLDAGKRERVMVKPNHDLGRIICFLRTLRRRRRAALVGLIGVGIYGS